MQIGTKIKIKPFLDIYQTPMKIGEIVAIEDDWLVIKVEVSGPSVSPFTVKRPWEVLAIE
jgi:hypothetical protein